MRKALCLVVVLAFLMGGCASLTSALGLAAEKVCGFSLADSQEAQMGINFIAAAAPLVGAGLDVAITAAQAEAILNQVAVAAQTGGCVLLTDLTNAMAFFDALAAEYNKTMKVKALKAMPVPAMSALRVHIRK